MKLWVWLLVLANILLFAYFNMDQVIPKVEVVNSELSADKLEILTAKDFETIPKKEGVTSAKPTSEMVTGCYKWGNFEASDLAAAQGVLNILGLDSEVKEESAKIQNRRFWVYYPPLASAELAKNKANEIKGLGVGELYILQDEKWKNAISFGLFSDEKLASDLLAELKTKGVRNATKALRSPGKAISSLLIKAVVPETALRLYKIKPEFLGTEIEPATCS